MHLIAIVDRNVPGPFLLGPTPGHVTYASGTTWWFSAPDLGRR